MRASFDGWSLKLDSDDEWAYTTEFLDGEKSTLRGGASRNERY